MRIQRKSTGGLRCGGTIIDHDLILTAAHCIENAKEDAKNFQILAGAHDMNAKEDARQIRNIKRINPHKGYNGWVRLTSGIVPDEYSENIYLFYFTGILSKMTFVL